MTDEQTKRIRAWKKATREVAEAGDLARWEMLHALVLAARGEARSEEARRIAHELSMCWGRMEARLQPSGVDR